MERVDINLGIGEWLHVVIRLARMRRVVIQHSKLMRFVQIERI